jgi:hypothetical protein
MEPPKVGDKIRVSMHGGKIVDAVITAILDTTDGLKYQVDFGKDQTATGVGTADCEGLRRLGLDNLKIAPLIYRFGPQLEIEVRYERSSI